MTVNQGGRPIEVAVHQHSASCCIVTIKVPGRHIPVASCSPEHADLIEAAMRLLVRSSPDVVRATLDMTPPSAVPGGDHEIHVTRAAGDTHWTVSSLRRETQAASLPEASQHVIDEIVRLAGRAVVVVRDQHQPSIFGLPQPD